MREVNEIGGIKLHERHKIALQEIEGSKFLQAKVKDQLQNISPFLPAAQDASPLGLVSGWSIREGHHAKTSCRLLWCVWRES